MAEQLLPLSACDVGVSVVHDCCQTWLIPLQRLPQTWHTICGPASTPKHLIYTERGLHSIPRMKTRLMAEWLLGIGWIYIDRLMDAQLHMVVERHDPCPKMNFCDLTYTQWLDLHPHQHITHTLREGCTCPAEPEKRSPSSHTYGVVCVGMDGWVTLRLSCKNAGLEFMC